MRRSWFLAIFLLITSALLPYSSVHCQNDQATASRKVINRVVPLYPSLARQMNLTGAVRLLVMVSANGTMKSVEVKGGSPLLVQSAEAALHNWRWEKTDHETSELVEFNFHP